MFCFRLETLTWVFQLVFGICALLVGFTLSAKKKSKKRRRWPTLSYFRTRVHVQEWLKTTNSSGTTKMEEFSLKLSEIVCKDLANAKEDKERIEAYIEQQIKEFQSSQRRPQEVRDALIFEVISRLVKSPSDPLGQRRASIMKMIITNSFENQGKESKPNAPHGKCSNLKPYLLGKLKTIWVNLSIISHTSSFVQLSIIIPIVITLLFYSLDYSSDFKVASIYGCQYISLEGQGNSFCNFFIDLPHKNYTIRETNNTYFKEELSGSFLFPAIVMLIIIISSFLHVIPSLVSVKHLYQCKQFMVNINNEKQNIRFSPEKFLTRYNLSQMESSLEGSLQLIVQSSTFLSNAWLLTLAEQELFNFPIHGNPLQFKILWQSIFLSLISLSLAQLKRRSVSQEYFSMGGMKNVLFFVACFCNTIFASLLFVCLATSTLDIMWTFDIDSTVTYVVVNTIVYLVMLTMVLLMTPLLRLPTSAIYPDILTTASPAYTEAIVKQCWAAAAISIISAFMNGWVYWEYAREDGMDEYLDGLLNYDVNQGHTTDSPFDPLFPSEAYPMNNRLIFYMSYMLVMPICWLVSSFLLHWYLEKDNKKMEFRQEQRKEKKGLAHLMGLLISGILQDFKPTVSEEGFWVDLNTESEDGMDVEDFVDQFEAKEKGAVVTVCQEEKLEENDYMEGEMETKVGADANDIMNTDDKLCENIPVTSILPNVETKQLFRLKEIQRSFDCWRPDADKSSLCLILNG